MRAENGLDTIYAQKTELVVELRKNRARALALVAGLTMLSGCVDDAGASVARIVIDATPTDPLQLVVSRYFETVNNNETGTRQAVLLLADTFQISADYDEEIAIASTGRIYVELTNNGVADETVRVQIYLDGDRDYDVSAQLTTGEFIKYLYTSLALG